MRINKIINVVLSIDDNMCNIRFTVAITLFVTFGLSFTPTLNAQIWEKIDGLGSQPLRTGASSQNGNLVIPIPDKGVYISNDNGINWVKASGAVDEEYSAIFKMPDGRMWLSGLETVYTSTDNGLSWIEKNDGRFDTYVFVFTYDIDNGLLAFDELSVCAFNFGSEMWEEIRYPSVDLFSVVSGCTLPDGRIVLYLSLPYTIWTSTDQGSSWSRSPESISSPYLHMSVATDGSMIMGSSDSIYITSNISSAWLRQSIPHSWSYVSSLLSINNQLYFLGTENGLTYTIDGGTTWSVFNNGMGQAHNIAIVEDLFVTSAGFLYACTDQGLYRTSLSVLSDGNTSLSFSHTISSAYPNPAPSGANVTLTYNLESAATLTLRVVDMLGRTVREESLGRIAPGAHTRSISTYGLTPGMYFYTLLPGQGKPLTGKMVVR